MKHKFNVLPLLLPLLILFAINLALDYGETVTWAGKKGHSFKVGFFGKVFF